MLPGGSKSLESGTFFMNCSKAMKIAVNF